MTKTQAKALCESIDLQSDFFDYDNEEWVLLRDNNLCLLYAYESLFTLAYGENSFNSFDDWNSSQETLLSVQ